MNERRASETMWWERYRKLNRNLDGAARFLIGDKVVFSGYAPDDFFNQYVCDLVNADSGVVELMFKEGE